MWLGLHAQLFSAILRGTDSELVWVCSSAPASCWWARSACWETKASWSRILDSSLWRGGTPVNTHIHYFLLKQSHSITVHSHFIHHGPAAWHLNDVHAELLDGCPDTVDLLCEPAVQSPLRHCLSVQSFQVAGDSLKHGLVALSGHTSTRAAGKKAS